MASISQNAPVNSLPDFRNLGVMLRILVIVTGLTLLAEALKNNALVRWLEASAAAIAFVLPVTIISLLILGLATAWLRRIDYRAAIAFVVIIELAVVTATVQFVWVLLPEDNSLTVLVRYWLFTVLLALALIGYFNLRNRALSPALAEARLQALQARIRPHFLFNSLNAVLSLMRAEPRRAETALEDLSELFRVLMSDNRKLIPLEQELELCRQYLDIESLRLEDRLNVDWRIEELPDDAMVPPLILQPLLENAVYHGIEPSARPGTISIHIQRKSERLEMTLSNPVPETTRPQSGNKMALANIGERLQLHFDAEATFATRSEGGRFEVRIVLPYVKGVI
ncbi:MAG: histidine kinase [Betaproteobacteria bacterium SG8_40]|nr:MAG: histidine kinase [Betaproteobacteria bacterium SG8_40]